MTRMGDDRPGTTAPGSTGPGSAAVDEPRPADRAVAGEAPLGSAARRRHRDEPAVGPATDWDLDLDPVPDAAEPGEAATAYEGLVRRQLALLGEDPDREGLLKTPQRVATSMAWLTRGYALTAEDVIGDALFAEEHRSMVLVRDIELYSMCEHHMLPFFGRAHIAYIPAGRIVGLSKLPRVVEVYARRLQVQERLTEEIAAAIERVLRPAGVGVVLECQHLCMMMRGVEKQASKTITSALRGSFRDDGKTRDEFLRLAHAPVGSAW